MYLIRNTRYDFHSYFSVQSYNNYASSKCSVDRIMKFILITQDFPPETGGIQTYSYELAKRWNEWSDRFEIIVPSKKQSESIDQGIGCPVHRIPCSNTLLPYFSIPLVSLMANWHRYPCVFHSQWQTLPASLLSRKVGFPQKIFVAAHARELLFNPFGYKNLLARRYESYRKSVLSKADHFFPVSHYTAGLLSDLGVRNEKMTVVPNGTDIVRFHPESAIALKKELDLQDRKIILTVTRIVERKGIDTVINAIPKMIDRYPDVIYLIGGGGPDRGRLEELVKHLGIDNYVRFLGRIPDNELAAYYNLCDVFVMPSKTVLPDVEGFGIVFLEAAACGKPVIGTYSGGIPDAVKHGETGLLVNENDPAQLAEALLRLLGDERMRKKLGSNGLERVREEANWDDVAGKIYSVMGQQMETGARINDRRFLL